MGVLLDPNHWTRAVNEIWRLRPTPGEPLSMDKARQILQIACKTLNDLVNDPDFGKDLKHLIALAAGAPGVPPANAKEFADFIAQFQRAEREMLLSSKMEERAVVELLAGTAIEFANLLALASNVDEVERRVRWLAKRTCEINLDIVREEDRAAFVDDVRSAIAGIAMVAVDGVVLLKAAAIPPAAAAAKGSIKLGFNKLVSSLKRWF